MTVQYSLTRHEVLQGFFYSVRNSARFRVTLLVCSVAVALAALAVGGLFSRPITIADLLTVLGWALGFLVLMPVWLFLFGNVAARSLTTSPEGISTRIGKRKGDVPWSKVKTVAAAGPYLLIASWAGNAFLVPWRAFTGDAQRAEFLREIERWRASSR